MIEYIDDVIAEVAAEMHDEGIRANDLNDPEFDSAVFCCQGNCYLESFL